MRQAEYRWFDDKTGVHLTGAEAPIVNIGTSEVFGSAGFPNTRCESASPNERPDANPIVCRDQSQLQIGRLNCCNADMTTAASQRRGVFPSKR